MAHHPTWPRTSKCQFSSSEVEAYHTRVDPLALPDWPGVAQIVRIERTWWEQGTRKQQVRYEITSLPPTIGTVPRLLQLKRRHWLIENRGHRARDVSLGEDASLIHRAGYHAITPGCATTVSTPRRPSPCSSSQLPLAHKPTGKLSGHGICCAFIEGRVTATEARRTDSTEVMAR